MRRLLVLVLGMLAAGPAWAGCYHYSGDGADEPTQKAPRAEMCFEGKCEKTAMQFTCGNANSVSTAFENGWKVERYLIEDEADQEDTSAAPQEEVIFSKNDKEVVDVRTLKCRPIDEDACIGFPN